MAELLPINVPPGASFPVPSSGDVAQTSLLEWAYSVTEGWIFNGEAFAIKGTVPDGNELTVAGITPQSYFACIARSESALGFAAVPLPEIQSQFWKVDPPVPLAQAPAAIGKAIVGKWTPSSESDTGWKFAGWHEEAWNIYPDGHSFATEISGSQTLYIVVARTRDDNTIIPIPYNPQPGTLPPGGILPPPPPPDPGGSGDPGGLDELELLLVSLGEAIDDLKTAGQDGSNLPPLLSEKCCKEITVSITAVARALVQIAIALPRGGDADAPCPPIDLAPIVRALAELASVISINVETSTAELKCICDGLAAINDTLQKGGAVDLSHLNHQADSQLDARARTQTNLDAIDAGIRADWAKYGSNF